MAVEHPYTGARRKLVGLYQEVFPHSQARTPVALTAVRELEYTMVNKNANPFNDSTLPPEYNDDALKIHFLNPARALLMAAYVSDNADFIALAKTHLQNTYSVQMSGLPGLAEADAKDRASADDAVIHAMYHVISKENPNDRESRLKARTDYMNMVVGDVYVEPQTRQEHLAKQIEAGMDAAFSSGTSQFIKLEQGLPRKANAEILRKNNALDEKGYSLSSPGRTP